MKTLRLALTVLSIGLLGVGYFASQWHYFRRESAGWAAWIDQPPVQYGATALLVLCVVFALVRDRQAESDES